MSILSRLEYLKKKHEVVFHEGEAFKQAIYGGYITDSDDFIVDKIELAIKHYPNIKEFSLGIYDSDSGSPEEFHHVVVIPIVDQFIDIKLKPPIWRPFCVRKIM